VCHSLSPDVCLGYIRIFHQTYSPLIWKRSARRFLFEQLGYLLMPVLACTPSTYASAFKNRMRFSFSPSHSVTTVYGVKNLLNIQNSDIRRALPLIVVCKEVSQQLAFKGKGDMSNQRRILGSNSANWKGTIPGAFFDRCNDIQFPSQTRLVCGYSNGERPCYVGFNTSLVQIRGEH
jgi:hypothetical protein